MHAIAYVSSAAWKLRDEDLELIVAQSRGFNTVSGVTGVLLYCDGLFMQYFEGPGGAVEETYARIRRSQRHRQINEMLSQAITVREFGEWSMGFSRHSASAFLQLAQTSWNGSEKSGPGADLLRRFGSNCRSMIA